MNNNIDKELKDVFAQLALEEAAVQEGADNFNAAQQRALDKSRISRTTAAQALMNSVFPLSVEAVKYLFNNAAPAAKAALKHGIKLGAEQCTLLALTCMFDKSGQDTQRVYTAIGNMIRGELEANKFIDAAPALAKAVLPVITKSTDAKYKSRAMAKNKEKAGVESMKKTGEFDAKASTILAARLVDAIVAASGIFQMDEERESRKGVTNTRYVLRLTDEAHNAMKYVTERAQWMQPVRPLMVTKPREWDESLTGGYLSAAHRLELLKRGSVGYLADSLASGALKPALSAMNILQGTAFRINKRVLAVAQHILDNDWNLGIIPQQSPLQEPALPVDTAGLSEAEANARIEAFKATQPEAWRAWKLKASKVKAFNASNERRAKIESVVKTLAIAREHADRDSIYFPVQMDYRTRLYYVPNYLNPQGTDLAKGLLEFAEGVPLTAAGARSLAIYGATTWANGGSDKLPMADRVQWVLDNEDKILACARDPLSNQWWAQADGGDKPEKHGQGAAAFLFLAFCFEWAGWKEHGENYVSHLVLFADGKCNGSQHHAMMARDANEAKYVCMTPMNVPDDLYRRVLTRTIEKLQAGLDNHETFMKPKDDADEQDEDGADDKKAKLYTVSELSAMLDGVLERSHVKRPTMTFSYGVTMLGVRDQLAADHKAFWEKFPKDARSQLINFAAQTIMAAVNEVVKASSTNMKFLQGVAKVLSKAGLPVNWTTPDGFFVQQRYAKYDSLRIRTVLSGGTKVRIDRSGEVRREVLKEAKAALRKVVKDKEERAELFDYLNEVLSFALFREMTKEARGVLRNNGSLLELATKKVGEVLAGAHEDYIELFAVLSAEKLREAYTVVEEDDGQLNITLRQPTAELDKAKQVSGVAPNFVHSHDAAHLRMTVNACYEAGITSFAAVHDSFGCHAEHFADMNRILREQFVRMYTEHDPLAELLETAKQSLPPELAEELPALPPKGDFDPHLVLDAEFFFA